jgi:hypothetical protein
VKKSPLRKLPKAQISATENASVLSGEGTARSISDHVFLFSVGILLLFGIYFILKFPFLLYYNLNKTKTQQTLNAKSKNPKTDPRHDIPFVGIVKAGICILCFKYA